MVDGLCESGHEIWFDEFELTPGAGWGRKIDKALDSLQSDDRPGLAGVDEVQGGSPRDRARVTSKNFAHRVLPVYLKPTDHVPWFLRTRRGSALGADPAKAIQRVKGALDHFEDK